jgi:hypothetical protein
MYTDDSIVWKGIDILIAIQFLIDPLVELWILQTHCKNLALPKKKRNVNAWINGRLLNVSE